MCDKNKINCQCDGNCNCGEILPNGMISCDNCGWKAPLAYNAATDRFACPSCRTESSFSSYNTNLKNKPMNKNNFLAGDFNPGAVGFGIGQAGFLNWNKNTLSPENAMGESNFANMDNSAMDFGDNISSQNMVGFAIGQSWMPVVPFDGSGQINESNFGGNLGNFGQKLRSGFIRFTPAGLVVRASFCNKYCKSLGYMRKADKTGFKRCVASCKINYLGAKDGKWTYPVAPEGKESDISPAELAAMSEKEVSAMPKDVVEQAAKGIANEEGSTPIPAKSNTMMYVIIGAVALIIVVALIMFMRKRSATA